MLRSLAVCIILMVLSPAMSAQSKALRYDMEVKQLAQLQRGIVLIPLLDEPTTPGIASQRDPEFQRIREHNNAVISAFTNFFSFTKVGFFFESNMEDIQAMRLEGNIMDEGRIMKQDLPKKPEDIFIATIFSGPVQIPLEVRAVGTKYDRKRAKLEEKSQEVIDKKALRAEIKARRLSEKIELKQVDWSPRQLSKALQRLNYLEDIYRPSEFDRVYSYFTADNLSKGGIVISRLVPMIHQKNDRVCFEFNYSYRARLHETTSVVRRFEEAVQQLQRTLDKKKEEIEKSMVSRI